MTNEETQQDDGLRERNPLNHTIYKRLEELMNKERLYLQHDLSREMICERLGVNRNRLAEMLREESSARNLKQYVNGKRVAYAKQLMQSHPHWSLDAICHACGMRTTAFKKFFHENEGCAPSVYRKNHT